MWLKGVLCCQFAVLVVGAAALDEGGDRSYLVAVGDFNAIRTLGHTAFKTVEWADGYFVKHCLKHAMHVHPVCSMCTQIPMWFA